jgi:hypothetical protein
VPTLVLSHGGTQAEEAQAMACLIPGAHHETMPGTAAIVMQEHRDAYLEAIERFVRDVRDEEAELESILATVLSPTSSTRRHVSLRSATAAGRS